MAEEIEDQFNLDRYLRLNRLPFNETEKNLVSFKGLFNIQNTSDFKEKLTEEKFNKAFPTYQEDIITNASSIPFNPGTEAAINPRVKKVWIKPTGSIYYDGTHPKSGSVVYDPLELLYRGHFSESINEGGNPNIEEIIMPLTKVYGTLNQYYVALAKENLTHTEYASIYNKNPNEPNGSTDYKFVSGNFHIGDVSLAQGNTTTIFPGELDLSGRIAAGSTLVYDDPTLGGEDFKIITSNYYNNWEQIQLKSEGQAGEYQSYVDNEFFSIIVDFSTSTTFNGSFSTSSLLSIGDRYFHKDKTQIGIRSIKFAKSPYRDYKNVTVGGVNFGDFTSVDTTSARNFASNGLESGNFIKKRYLPLRAEGGTSDEEMEALFGTNGLDAPNADVSTRNSGIIPVSFNGSNSTVSINLDITTEGTRETNNQLIIQFLVHSPRDFGYNQHENYSSSLRYNNRRIALKDANSDSIFANLPFVLKNFISPFKF